MEINQTAIASNIKTASARIGHRESTAWPLPLLLSRYVEPIKIGMNFKRLPTLTRVSSIAMTHIVKTRTSAVRPSCCLVA